MKQHHELHVLCQSCHLVQRFGLVCHQWRPATVLRYRTNLLVAITAKGPWSKQLVQHSLQQGMWHWALQASSLSPAHMHGSFGNDSQACSKACEQPSFMQQHCTCSGWLQCASLRPGRLLKVSWQGAASLSLARSQTLLIIHLQTHACITLMHAECCCDTATTRQNQFVTQQGHLAAYAM